MEKLTAEQKMQRIIFLLPEVLKRLFQGEVFEHDVSHSQCKVLHILGYRKKLTMTELSEILSVEMSSATALVDSLVKLGYVERTRSEADRRVVTVELTKNGCEKFKNFTAQVKRSISNIFSRMTDKQQNKVINGFEQLYNVLIEVTK